MSDGIWIGRPVDDETAALATVEELWAELDNTGPGGRLVNVPEGEAFHPFPDRLVGRLQQFSEGLASELRFKAVEIFISPISNGNWLKSTPFLVGGAYRYDDKTYGPAKRVEKDGRDRGVYALSNSALKPLRELYVHGERHSAWVDRMNRFATGKDDPDVEYVKYKVNGTIVAWLAGNIPYAKRGPGAVLWDRAKPLLNHTREPSKATRDALSCLIEANGGMLLLEAGEDPTRAVEGLDRVLSRREERGVIKTSDAARVASPAAIELWRQLSDGGEAICQTLRELVSDLPGEVPQFLFEARPHTYLPYLQSATLEVEKNGEFVRHADLPGRIAAARGKRNQPIDIVAKTAYEHAAPTLLGAGGLQSMLLIPFAASSSPGRGVHGFVRLMNRFAHGKNYTYEKNDVAETHLASALTTVLSRVLADDSLLGFGNGNGSGHRPTNSGENNK